jgi:hypothetical protein
VTVQITAGIAAPPQDDVEAEADPNYDPRYSGWFVLCNDRVVLAADKSERTGWGTPGLARWHAQYNGFVGVARFQAANPALLPWDTTKRDVELSDPIFRRALRRMKDSVQPYIAYTNLRKKALPVAREIENRLKAQSYFEVSRMPQEPKIKVPDLPHVAKITTLTIRYTKPPGEVDEVREALGDPDLSASEVGLRTFDHYRDKFVAR